MMPWPKLMAAAQDRLLITLRGYQEDGVAFAESRHGRCMLDDEMGVGKTIQALAWCALRPELAPVVVVGPASVKYGWADEIQKCIKAPGKVEILSGRTGNVIHHPNYILVNYEILGNKMKGAKKKQKDIPHTGWVDYIRETKPRVVIIDETQRIKNWGTIGCAAVQRLCRGVPHVIGLSGTPIENCPYEFWTIISLIAPHMFDYDHFTQRYCNPKWNGFGWNLKGASHTDELHAKLRNIMIRRLKVDVLPELPPKTTTVVPMDIDNKREYHKALNYFGSWAREHRGAGMQLVENQMATLLKVMYEGKAKACQRWVSDFKTSGQKLVLYAWHRRVIDEYMNKYKDIAVRMDGSVTGARRQKAVQRFATDPKIRLAVCNYKVVLGMNGLQGVASNVAWLELPWLPTDFDQANDRLHRIGQLADSVNIWVLAALGTIEEDQAALLDMKREILNQVLDGKKGSQQHMLTVLVNRALEQMN